MTMPSAVVRVSIVSEDRRLDVAIPSSLPLVEVIPGFARSLGVLDPTLVHAGYALRRADGGTLDASLGATAQGVHDGDVLTLVRGGLLAEPRVYDDITEAVIDATSEQHREWTPRDNARTALAVSLTFLGLCAVLLVSAGRDLALAPLLAGGAAALLLAASAVLGRLGQSESGHALGLAAAGFAGLAAYLAVDGALYGWPLAAAGLAAALVGAAALALAPTGRQLHLIGAVGGVALALPAAIAGWRPGAGVAAYAVTIAVIGATGNLLPWLALTSTRIRVISPQSEQEVFADPGPVDAEGVKARAAAGARTLLSLRIGLAAAALLATPLLASHSVAGALLTAFAFVGMMFQSRQAYARSAVVAVMALGAAGLALTGLTLTVARPDLRAAMLVITIGVTGVLVALTLLSPRVRIGLARAADTVEVILMALLIPLGVITAGWV